MPALVAVLLPPSAAAGVIADAWAAGEAVLPLDPAAPEPELRARLAALRPTHLVDAGGRSARPDGVPAPEGVGAVVATSGTTGAPKGVELTAAGIRASALASSAALGTREGDRWLACLPMHGVAVLAVLARAMHTGLPLTVHDRFDAERVLAEADVTVVSLVPTTLARLLRAGADAYPRLVLLGGAPVPAGLVERAAAQGITVVTSYGLTETFGGVVLDRRPIEGAELALDDAGQILVRGPMVMRGYAGDAEATKLALDADGWLATGDLGILEPDGRLRVTGRLRDLVICGGLNVVPDEVEAVLRQHPGVADVGVAGLPDPEWGERVVAWVVPADPADPPTLAALRDFAGERMARAKAPSELVLVGALPRNGGGKLLRRALPGLKGLQAGPWKVAGGR
jgi:O-succinylbenzoic acid--CoA ligase